MDLNTVPSPISTEQPYHRIIIEPYFIDIVMLTFRYQVLSHFWYSMLTLPRYEVLTITGISKYTDDVNLIKKIKQWEKFYNFNRPHKSHGGLTPYKIMKKI